MPSESPLWYLKNFHIFKGIPPEKIDEVAGTAHMQTYHKGDIVYKAGDEAKDIYIIKQGEVLLFREDGGKKVVFETLGAGSLFGGIQLHEDTFSHFAEVAVGSKICRFPRGVMFQLISTFPESMVAFWQDVSERMREYEDRLAGKNSSAKEMLFEELQRLQKTRKKGFFGFLQRPLIITHEELAKRTGMNRVTITRAMQELRDEGRIRVDEASGAIEVVG